MTAHEYQMRNFMKLLILEFKRIDDLSKLGYRNNHGNSFTGQCHD